MTFNPVPLHAVGTPRPASPAPEPTEGVTNPLHPRSTADRPQTAIVGKLEPSERNALRQAAFKATKVYPGPVGALLSRELTAWEAFGFRLGGHSIVKSIVAHIEAIPDPEPPVNAVKPMLRVVPTTPASPVKAAA